MHPVFDRRLNSVRRADRWQLEVDHGACGERVKGVSQSDGVANGIQLCDGALCSAGMRKEFLGGRRARCEGLACICEQRPYQNEVAEGEQHRGRRPVGAWGVQGSRGHARCATVEESHSPGN